VASTSVAICDKSPLLQSNGPTVTKEKYIGAYFFCAYLIVSRIMKFLLNKINSVLNKSIQKKKITLKIKLNF
jgi:hypothetical protein